MSLGADGRGENTLAAPGAAKLPTRTPAQQRLVAAQAATALASAGRAISNAYPEVDSVGFEVRGRVLALLPSSTHFRPTLDVSPERREAIRRHLKGRTFAFSPEYAEFIPETNESVEEGRYVLDVYLAEDEEECALRERDAHLAAAREAGPGGTI